MATTHFPTAETLKTLTSLTIGDRTYPCAAYVAAPPGATRGVITNAYDDETPMQLYQDLLLRAAKAVPLAKPSVPTNGAFPSFRSFSTSPYETYTSWNLLLGATVSWTSTYCASQTQLQRYSSIGSVQDARRALLLNIPGVALTLLMSVLSGLTIYAVYWDSDPMLTGDIDKPDQLMPYIVQDLLRCYPGLSGLLVAAVFSGSLSTLSSGYNALAAVTWHDFVRPKVNITEAAALRVTKCMAAAYGLLSIGIAFLAGATESIVHATASLVGALSGPLLAIFFLGIFFPCCRKKGAMAGILVGIAISGWQALGSIVYPRQADALPTSTAGCSNFNRTIHAGSYESPPAPSGMLRFYHISFMWVVLVGFLTHMIVSLVVSFVFERNEKDCVDPQYICPFIRPCMRNYARCSKDADNALGEQVPTVSTSLERSHCCRSGLHYLNPATMKYANTLVHLSYAYT
nr:sodium-coupled monocarboxylate transporter 1-like [Dermacentor andersoni]